MVDLPKNLSKFEWVLLFVGLISSLCTIIGTIALLIPQFRDSILATWFVAQNFILIVLLALLAGYFIRIAETRGTALKEWEKNRYEIPRSIHGFIHEMRDFFSNDEEHCYNPSACYTQLMKACNHCKTIFNRLTNVENTVTIKMVVDNDDAFRTIARDQIAASNRRCLQIHPIAGNTAFMHIVNTNLPESQFYINNNLQNDKNYLNTNKNWQKEYNATILVPIRKNDILLGCLAVDCFKKPKTNNKKKNAFDEIYNDTNHVQLLAIFADLIYCVLDKTIKFTDDLQNQLETEGVQNV